jgi:hypothetical protein
MTQKEAFKKLLFPDNTAADTDSLTADNDSLGAFNADGFSLQASTGQIEQTNLAQITPLGHSARLRSSLML